MTMPLKIRNENTLPWWERFSKLYKDWKNLRSLQNMREGLTKLNEQGGTQQLHSVNAYSRNGSRGELGVGGRGGQLPASHDTNSQSVQSKSGRFKFKSGLHTPFSGEGGLLGKTSNL
jgi:hypothetical protein